MTLVRPNPVRISVAILSAWALVACGGDAADTRKPEARSSELACARPAGTSESASAHATATFSDDAREQLTREAAANVETLVDLSHSHFRRASQAGDGSAVFPPSTDLTPSASPRCEGGWPVPYHSDRSTWSDPTWQSLGFAIEGEHYYRYRYMSSTRGPRTQFTAQAIGDLDCDGVLSTFERVGFIGEDQTFELGSGLFTASFLE